MALRIRSSREIFTLLLLLFIVLNISPLLQSTSISTEENIESYSRFVVAGYDSELLFVADWDESNDAWTESGVDPYLGDNTDYIYVSGGALAEGWFSFPDTSLTGSITANISIYAKNDDGAGNDHIEVWVDYVGGSGSNLGDCNCDISYGWFTFSIGDLTAAQVNVLRVKFVSGMVSQPDDVYVERVKIGLSAEVSEGESYSITINEIIEIFDSLDTSVSWGVTVQEILDIADSQDTSVSWGVVVNEILEIYSTVVAVIVGDSIYSIIINEVIVISEAITTGVSLFIVLTEIVELFDSVNALINPVDAIIINVIISIGDNEIIQGGLEGINIFYELFLTNNMWGYLGVIGLVIIGYFLTKREKFLGVLWFVVECLFVAQYLALVDAHPGYWWHIFILLLGGLFTCVYPLLNR